MQQIILLEDLEKLSPYINENMMRHIKLGQIAKFECHEQINFISFDWVDILDVNSERTQIIIYFSEDNLFFICQDEQCLKKVKNLVKEGTSHERIVYSFFLELISGDTDFLEKLEENITDKEDDLITNSKREGTQDIIAFRRELIKLKKYYEQLNHIFEGLIENENHLITHENLRYFRILDSRVDRLFATVLNLRDYVTQVREAYQAQIDIEQNSIMKVFTVVTAIFLPLTLLVGWYGMNLRLPEFSWKYGYPFIVSLSIIIVIVCIIIFKRKKWF